MVRPDYVQTLQPKSYMVSYMENGTRVKYFVRALRKPDAIDVARSQGAKPMRRISVQVLIETE